jgi:hypothetical protein
MEYVGLMWEETGYRWEGEGRGGNVSNVTTRAAASAGGGTQMES